MKSYVAYEPGKCKIADDMPMPKYGEYDALVKLESCGVCSGTDAKDNCRCKKYGTSKRYEN